MEYAEGIIYCVYYLDQSWWYGDMLGFVVRNGVVIMTFLFGSGGIIAMLVVLMMGLLW